MILAETMVDLLRDWHHWGFEIVAAIAEFIVVGLIGAPLFRRWLKHHDRKHAHQHCEDVHQDSLFSPSLCMYCNEETDPGYLAHEKCAKDIRRTFRD